MTEQDRKITKMLSILCVQQHLLLSVFDAIENKDIIIEKFTRATEMDSVKKVYSEMPADFVAEFCVQRDVMLTLLSLSK